MPHPIKCGIFYGYNPWMALTASKHPTLGERSRVFFASLLVTKLM